MLSALSNAMTDCMFCRIPRAMKMVIPLRQRQQSREQDLDFDVHIFNANTRTWISCLLKLMRLFKYVAECGTCVYYLSSLHARPHSLLCTVLLLVNYSPHLYILHCKEL